MAKINDIANSVVVARIAFMTKRKLDASFVEVLKSVTMAKSKPFASYVKALRSVIMANSNPNANFVEALKSVYMADAKTDASNVEVVDYVIMANRKPHASLVVVCVFASLQVVKTQHKGQMFYVQHVLRLHIDAKESLKSKCKAISTSGQPKAKFRHIPAMISPLVVLIEYFAMAEGQTFVGTLAHGS
jgi:hypothetical protein